MAGVPSATSAPLEPAQFVSVAIIGGGVAGLAAAGALAASSSSSSSTSTSVLLLEAREALGGRVRQLRGLAPWPVEMGPEFVHGERSSVVQILRDAGCSLQEYEWPDRWFFDDERVLRKAAEEEKEKKATPSSSSSSSARDRDVSRVQDLFASVAEEEEASDAAAAAAAADHTKEDISARQWMNKRGLTSKRQQDIAEACFANDFGASLDALGLRELVVENQEWDVGEAYYVPDAPLSELVKALEARVPRGCVRKSWPVSRVEVVSGAAAVRRELSSSSSSGVASNPPRQIVKLTGPHGRVVLAKRVVVALPLAVLKASLLSARRSSPSSFPSPSSSSPHPSPLPSSLIQFSPPLSAAKLAAMERLLVGNAIKVILSFSKPFWPEDFFDALCPGCFVPEFWVKSPPAKKHFNNNSDGSSNSSSSDASSLSPHVVTGFLCGRFAQEAQALGEEETVMRALEQLDEMFQGGGERNTTSPASDSLVASRVVDWSRDPWALGAYSHPSLGAQRGDRRALASPESGGALFFAGEATHEAVNPCLQAAIETGQRAAKEVLLAEEEEEEKMTMVRRSKL